MGNEVFNDFHPYQYQVFKTEPKPGESSILVRPDSIQGLSKKNLIDRYTQIDCLEYYLEKIPNDDFLGTREYDPKEKKYLTGWGRLSGRFFSFSLYIYIYDQKNFQKQIQMMERFHTSQNSTV